MSTPRHDAGSATSSGDEYAIAVPVKLNVYDIEAPTDRELIPNLNNWMLVGGMGVFHSGVEVYGREYCFGGHPDASSGVFQVPPRCAPDAKFRESVYIGKCYLDEAAVGQIIANFSSHWPGNRYNLLSRNCNHFASELCETLTGKTPPAWVNRLAWLGEKAKFLLPNGFDAPMMAPVTAARAGAQERDDEIEDALAGLDENERRRAAEISEEVRAAAIAANIDPDDDFEPDHAGRHGARP